ncbi:Uncharacterised protein at_DN2466 [Pycnogonum litorale]
MSYRNLDSTVQDLDKSTVLFRSTNARMYKTTIRKATKCGSKPWVTTKPKLQQNSRSNRFGLIRGDVRSVQLRLAGHVLRMLRNRFQGRMKFKNTSTIVLGKTLANIRVWCRALVQTGLN